MEQRDILSNDLLINNTSQANLVTAAKWGKFLAIVGFIFIAIMILAGIWAQTLLSTGSPNDGPGFYEGEFLKYIGIVYVIFAAILFFPCLYLFRFSNKTMEAVKSSSQESLDAAFINLKSMFKFYGIFTVVILVLYALAFLAGMGTMMMQ